MTFRDAIHWATTSLTNNENPFLDSILLACHACSINKEHLLASLPDPFPTEHEATFRSLVELRRKGTPLAYIVGFREFWGMKIAVGSGVLIPRPDTETLVECAVDIIRKHSLFRAGILDLCTGSGCIACALFREFPEASITASDISRAALAFARRNAQLYAPEITITESNLFSHIRQKFDLIVTNPPYITDNEYGALSREVRQEPSLALCGGSNGLGIIQQIIVKSVERMENNGYLCMEAAPAQAQDIAACMEKAGYTDIGFRKDLGGHIRVTLGRKNA